MMSVEQVEKVYNRFSGVYDWVFGKIFQNGRELGPALLDLEPGMKLLEVGVGTGLSLQMLPRMVDVTGIDLSEKMLSQARERVEQLGLRNIELLKMDATQLEFPDNSFDRVYAAYFISTVPDPVKVMRELKRVCKPGGYLVFLNHFQSTNPVLAAAERVISPICYHIGFRSDLNLKWLMQETGLEVESLEGIGTLGYWKALRCVNHKQESAAERPQD
jgi:phosphatidylethanolamine/phosphatidyl-N-methylethanolamine N-methyltransferase